MEFNASEIAGMVLLAIVGILGGYLVSNYINREKALYKALTQVIHIGGSEFIYKEHTVKKDKSIVVVALCLYYGGSFTLNDTFQFHINDPKTLNTLSHGGRLSIERHLDSGIYFLQDGTNNKAFAGTTVNG